jgi:glycosyltransferase involved in cell wall biosynthesis
MSATPTVSIVMPTLNEEAYIERTLKSLRDQDLDSPYEIVIGDGYSTDNTLRICSRYADRIVLEKKKTPAAGRQSAVRESRGSVIAFCCADSFYPRDWLRELTQPIIEGKAGAVSGVVLPDGGSILDNVSSRYILAPLALGLSKLGIYFTPGETVAVSREAFDLVGGFRVDMVTAEDMDLTKRISKKARVMINPRAKAYVSMRRVKKWGRFKYLMYHISNFVSYQLTSGSHSQYEPVR